MGSLEQSLRTGATFQMEREDLDLMAEVISVIEERAFWVPGITTGPAYTWDKERGIRSVMTATFYEPEQHPWEDRTVAGTRRRLSMEIYEDGTFDLGII